MSKLIQRRVLLAKTEVTQETDAAPTAADAVQISNLSWNLEKLRKIERKRYRSTLAGDLSRFGGTLRGITFDVELKGAGTVDVAPEFGPLLLACAMQETINASTSVVYTEQGDTQAQDACTIWLYDDGKLYKLVGCMGTYEIDLTAGQNPMLKFSMIGKSVAPTDSALITPTLDATEPEAVLEETFTMDGYAADFASLKIQRGAVVSAPDSATANDGFSLLRISEVATKFSVDPLDVLVASYDFEAAIRDNSEFAISFGTHGSTAGNQVDVDLGNCSYDNQSPGDREGQATIEIEGTSVESSAGAEDAITITFT